MQFFDVILSLAALFGLGAFLTLRCRLPGALAPLAGLSLVSLWFTLAGMAGLLRPAGWLALALGFGLGIWAFWPRRGQKLSARQALGQIFTPGAALFWGLTLAFLVYFAIRQPLFSDFDEFSFWGTAAKLTKVNDTLYTECEVGWAWQATQNPGLITLSYFLQFLGSFAPWKVYLAYDALLFACFGAVLGATGWKKYENAVALGLICWCVPWFFTTYCRTIYLSGVYMTSYGDIPAGVVLGGAVAFWLCLRQAEKAPFWTLLPVLALTGNIKSNTFVLSLVAAGLVAADCFFFPKGSFKKGLLRRVGGCAACFAAPLALYLGWSRYIAGLVAANAGAGGMGETSENVVTVAISGIRILLGLPVGDYYTQRLDRLEQAGRDMTTAFWSMETGNLTAIGCGAIVVAFIWLTFLAAFVVAGEKRLRLRTGLAALLSTGGFVAYNFMLVLSYAFIFKEFQCEALEDYNRYIYTYYIAWFLIALAFLSLALQKSRLPLLGGTGALALALVMMLRVNQLVLPQFSVLGFSDASFADQRISQARADAVTEAVEPDSRIFLVSQGEDGKTWFEYSYDFLPLIVDYSGDLTRGGGGGTFGLPELRPEENENYNGWLYYHPYTAQEWADTVRSGGCSYIFIDELDEIFIESYADLFSDGLQAARSGSTLLYRVTESGLFTPVEMEVPQ